MADDFQPRYISTRGRAPAVGFIDALLTGLAPDGGLYVPEAWPQLSAADIEDMKGLGYAEIATRVMAPFVGDAIAADDFAALVGDTYAVFDDPAVAPLKELGDGLWLMELFHGPTLAFKDYALQFLGRLFDHVLAERGERITIIGATSGDTGSAAIAGCRIGDRMEIFILHPEGRPSEVQRRQMTTVLAHNVHNIALAGSFDDCQDAVKAMFDDEGMRAEFNLSAVNSINWARIMAQIVYYVVAAVKLGAPEKEIAFAVPTGNFGNVYAAYAASRMGLGIDRLIVGSNANDSLARTFATGTMKMEPVQPTLSPSMDIQVPSNFERLIFDLYDRDGDAVTRLLAEFREKGVVTLPRARLAKALTLFTGATVSDDETLATIRAIHAETGMLVDPHTSVGITAARRIDAREPVPVVALACAHPAKFPDAVVDATGERPALPERLADLYEREERLAHLANDIGLVKEFVRAHTGLH
ncbi:MAG: threonine synthase [Alphaproteobacteria bacterium]|nr:threonine synthase [Alphaproteobacteria bacterium]MCZ6765244.1 threonine synthase [Alphaproteobacteria bacterium]